MTAPFRLHVETLENRDCPSSANLFNGVLTVVGTGGNDSIVVNRIGNAITAAGKSFAVGSVQKVVITALDGDDYISNRSGLPAIIYGGNGNDTILGGSANDVIYGGSGNDTIYGRRGNDIIYGGGGTNAIDGGPGANNITAGSANRQRGNTALEARIIQLVNNYRVANGLAPLTVNNKLNAAATLHSNDMVAISNIYGPQRGMQHVLFGTVRPEVTDRLDSVGYDNWVTSFAWGENIAFGYTSATAVVNAWINSPGHRANILNGTFTETGVSVRIDAAGRLFFTQVFGHIS